MLQSNQKLGPRCVRHAHGSKNTRVLVSNIMPNIQSIICFNGGSAGDFLKVCCLHQLGINLAYRVDSNGTALLDTYYFKNMCQGIYNKTANKDQIISSQTHKIENSHYYHDFFTDIATNLFFIDYPESINLEIIKIYVKKRQQNNAQNLVNAILPGLPAGFANKINADNIYDVCNITWLKNLKNWQNNDQLQSIQFADIINRQRLPYVVETVTGQELTNLSYLYNMYDEWVGKNPELFQLFL